MLVLFENAKWCKMYAILMEKLKGWSIHQKFFQKFGAGPISLFCGLRTENNQMIVVMHKIFC